MRRWKDEDESHVFFIFNLNKADIKLTPSLPEGRWKKILDSSHRMWNGPGTLLPEKISPGEEITLRGHSFVVYTKEGI